MTRVSFLFLFESAKRKIFNFFLFSYLSINILGFTINHIKTAINLHVFSKPFKICFKKMKCYCYLCALWLNRAGVGRKLSLHIFIPPTFEKRLSGFLVPIQPIFKVTVSSISSSSETWLFSGDLVPVTEVLSVLFAFLFIREELWSDD